MSKDLFKDGRGIWIAGAEVLDKRTKKMKKCSIPSQKNGRSGKFANPKVTAFIKQSSLQWHAQYDKWKALTEGLDKPYHILLTFVRAQNMPYDLHNAAHVIADCMSGNHYFKRRPKGELNTNHVYSGLRNPKFNPKRQGWLPYPEYTGEYDTFEPHRLKWVEDDDIHNLNIICNPKMLVDPENPGVFIHVFKSFKLTEHGEAVEIPRDYPEISIT